MSVTSQSTFDTTRACELIVAAAYAQPRVSQSSKKGEKEFEVEKKKIVSSNIHIVRRRRLSFYL